MSVTMLNLIRSGNTCQASGLYARREEEPANVEGLCGLQAISDACIKNGTSVKKNTGLLDIAFRMLYLCNCNLSSDSILN